MKGMNRNAPSANQQGKINPASINYNRKKFRSISTNENGEVIYNYFQDADIVWGNYSGGKIVCGNLTGIINDRGDIEYVYEHLTTSQEYFTGKCLSKPELLSNGTINLRESWESSTGKTDAGHSILVEI